MNVIMTHLLVKNMHFVTTRSGHFGARVMMVLEEMKRSVKVCEIYHACMLNLRQIFRTYRKQPRYFRGIARLIHTLTLFYSMNHWRPSFLNHADPC